MEEKQMKQLADFITAKVEGAVSKIVFKNVMESTKDVLTTAEAAKYLGLSKSHLYKLTWLKIIPHYKPMGKLCYFNRQELDEWLQSNRVATDAELEQTAQAYCMKKGGVR